MRRGVSTGRSMGALAVGLAAALSVLSLAPAARAQGAGGIAGFQPSGDYLVEIDGKPSPKAKVYFAERMRSFLVVLPELPSPVLIDVALRSVATVDLMKMAPRPDGAIDLLPQPTLAQEGSFELAGEDVALRSQGRSLRLKPRPFLLGRQDLAAMLGYSPEYQRRATGYAPVADVVGRLKAVQKSVQVLVFFGSWCPHCRDHVPYLLKVEQLLSGSRLRFDYYGLPRSFAGDAEARKWSISAVPAGVVLVDGKEVGRIAAARWASPESAIYDILKSAGAL